MYKVCRTFCEMNPGVLHEFSSSITLSSAINFDVIRKFAFFLIQ